MVDTIEHGSYEQLEDAVATSLENKDISAARVASFPGKHVVQCN
jgi:hypothetical protein